MSDTIGHYSARDIRGQGEYFTRHMQAMTAERLHAKAEIAAELAHRDIQIERLRMALDNAAGAVRMAFGPDDPAYVFAEKVLKETL